MARRALPALFAFAALVADLSGAHGFAVLALLGAIPFGFVLVLDCYADALGARCGIGRPLLAAGGLALLVLSAALRSPAVVGGVPRLAVSAVVLCLLLYAGAILRPIVAPQPARRQVETEEAEPERLAA